jgi:hypothetical protein
MLVINILIYGIGAHVFFSSVCPNKYHIALLNISFYVILTYSYIEMYAKKLYYHENMSQIRKFIEVAKNKPEIEIIKFNDVITSVDKNRLCIHHLLLYDFIIYSDYSRPIAAQSSSSRVNKVLYSGSPVFPLNYSYSLCKFSFISINVKLFVDYKEKSYAIKLVNDSENYYIVGNKINRLIICYLLMKQHRIICDEITREYRLELIDHNVDMKTLTERDEIVLNENDYKVVPFVFTDTSNMTVKDVEKLCNYYPSFDSNAESKEVKNLRMDSGSIPE